MFYTVRRFITSGTGSIMSVNVETKHDTLEEAEASLPNEAVAVTQHTMAADEMTEKFPSMFTHISAGYSGVLWCMVNDLPELGELCHVYKISQHTTGMK
jgi:hypothetical protein